MRALKGVLTAIIAIGIIACCIMAVWTTAKLMFAPAAAQTFRTHETPTGSVIIGSDGSSVRTYRTPTGSESRITERDGSSKTCRVYETQSGITGDCR